MTDVTEIDFGAHTRTEIVSMFYKQGLECGDKGIEVSPVIHKAWSQPAYRTGDWETFRKVEDSVFSWWFDYSEWPTLHNLISKVAGEHRVSRDKARDWINKSIKAPLGHSFIARIPATATEYEIMPSIPAKLSASGQTLTFKCPFCGGKHSHGAEAQGHRVSHCPDASAFPEGYSIQEGRDEPWRVSLLPQVFWYVAARFYISAAQTVAGAA